MPTLECPFDGCPSTTVNDSEAMAIALFNAHISTHTASASSNVQRPGGSKSEKIIRPKVAQGMLEEAWNSFLIQWKIYKSSAVLSAAESQLQLIYCCEQDLLENVLRSEPDITSKDERDQLESIRRLSVVPVAMGVRRSEVLNLTQDSNELVRSFFSRIQGKAATCNFFTKCTATCCAADPPAVDFSQDVIKYILVNGLADAEIRRDILSWKELDSSSLSDTIAYIESKEMARDAYKSEVVSMKNKSQYTKQHSDPKLKLRRKCEMCETQISQYVLLRSGKVSSERKLCKKCWNSKKEQKEKSSSSADEASSIVHRLSSFKAKDMVTTKYRGRTAVVLSHHMFDSIHGWRQRPADKQPSLKVDVKICVEMYDDLQINHPPDIKPMSLEGVADSGAQSCLLSLRQFYKCGFKKSHLVPVKLKMEAANRKSIGILGAIFLTISASGQTTHAMVYVSPDVQGFYISKQCLTELGCLSRSFPCAGEIDRLESAAIIGNEIKYNDQIQAAPPLKDEKKAKCGCLLRETPPERPSALPMPCTPANIDKMKE